MGHGNLELLKRDYLWRGQKCSVFFRVLLSLNCIRFYIIESYDTGCSKNVKESRFLEFNLCENEEEIEMYSGQFRPYQVIES